MNQKELIAIVTDEIKALDIEGSFILSSLLTPAISVEEEHVELHAYYSTCNSKAVDKVVESINIVALTIAEEDKPGYYKVMQQCALAPIKEYFDEKRISNLN